MIFERKINYYETDAMQVVHHSNYIRYMEESRLYALEKMGLPYEKIEEAGIMIPVLGVECEYKHFAKYGDTIQIDVKPKEYTGVRIVMEYTIKNKDNGELVALAETKHCFTDKNLKPISLKKHNPEMHNIFEKWHE